MPPQIVKKYHLESRASVLRKFTESTQMIEIFGVYQLF